MIGEQYDEAYFLRGKESGKSLYENYHWMPEQTVPMVERMIDHIGIQKGETILDFGCARGYVVKAFRQLGYDAFGIDVSQWAIDNADKEVKQYVKSCCDTLPNVTQPSFDWIIAKDVLEHVPYVRHTVRDLMNVAIKGVFVVVPLSEFDGNPYVIAEYEKDITHVQRYTLNTWAGMFLKRGWFVEMSYRVPGIKDNWVKPGWENGNGFILAQRL